MRHHDTRPPVATAGAGARLAWLGMGTGGLRLAAATRLLASDPDHAAGSGSGGLRRVAALAGCHHACLRAGRPFAFGWARSRTGGPVTVITTSPATGAGLVYPPAARGRALAPDQVADLLSGTACWVRLQLRHDSLVTPDTGHVPAPLDEALLDAWTGPFGWLVVATAVPPDVLHERVTAAARAERDTTTGATGESAGDLVADRAMARYRELRAAESTGAWQVHLLAGAASAAAAATVAGVLAAGLDLSAHGYTVTPAAPVPGLDEAVADRAAAALTGTPVLAGIAAPPAGEIPGVAVHTQSTFATTPSEVHSGLRLGRVLDRSEHPSVDLVLSGDSLARHTFITGATGAGKTTTITHLLTQANRAEIPWLVVEPTKAEYRHRLTATVLRVGDPQAPAVGINPLQPADGFPPRTHADMAKAMLVAAFHAVEPFPQVLAAAIEACYHDTGWNLGTGEPLHPDITPRWPTLVDLTAAARRIIAAVGYGPEVQANVTGFLNVRLGSLTTGTAATFLAAHHQIDMRRLLGRNVILELEDVGDDADKSVVMGTFLLRLTQQLRVTRDPAAATLRHLTVVEEAYRLLRRPDHPGPEAAAVEAFANMPAEMRAYGEGLIIADQIPAKLITDVIKNTAVKILHRLPGRDDRDAAGAATNLTTTQSARLVGLPPGTAAVATDGMPRPVLVTIPAPATTAHTEPRSAAELATAPHDIPTVGDLARAAGLARLRPALAVWADLTVLAHLLGLPHPTPRDDLAVWLGRQNPALLHLAFATLARESVHARTSATLGSHHPAEFAAHITDDLTRYLRKAKPCPDPPQQWVAHPYRYNPARRALQKAIHDNPDAGRHPDSVLWRQENGHPIDGDTATAQLKPSTPTPPTRRHRSPTPTGCCSANPPSSPPASAAPAKTPAGPTPSATSTTTWPSPAAGPSPT